MAENGPLAMQVRNAVRELARDLPGRFPKKLEVLLMAADGDTQREFIALVQTIQTEHEAAERQAARRALVNGRW